MNLFEKVQAALSKQFVRCQDVARVLTLAFASGKNVLLWGPGGHGKSEMVESAIKVVANAHDVFVQSFGEGMDEATLWGGLDFAALDRDKTLIYHPENSFLAKDYAVFEEMFDAPASVLLALKDTLTSRKLRKGSQVFAMKTKVIVAITNKDPSELADLGPAAAALVERFPLQLCVKWSAYEGKDYLELFQKVAPGLPGADLNGTTGVLAEVMAKASADGDVVSPRTAVHALGIVKTSAALRGVQKVEKQDLLDLTFLPGMEQFAANLRQELDAAYERAAAEGRVQEAERKLRTLLGEFGDAAGSPIKLLQVSKRLQVFGDEASGLAVTDGLVERRKQLRDSAAAKAAEAQQQALENTRI